MAGHILKIVMEDTHPPVWRRVIIPEKITFYDLHLVIQILFGWENDHLHDFRIPSKDIRIFNSDDVYWDNYYPEETTLVEQIFPQNKWIRYTYDFGDNWRHKVIYEKSDESYQERYASLLKAKGDNFEEDSGGIWGCGEDRKYRYAFDGPKTAEELKTLLFPVCENAEEPASFMRDEEAKNFFDKLTDIIRTYGIVDFDSLRGMFRKIYHTTISKDNLRRYIHWYADVSHLVQIGSSADTETSYVAAVELDFPTVLEKMQKYAGHLGYVSFTARDLKQTAGNILERTEWGEMLYDVLIQNGLPEQAILSLLTDLFPKILVGCPLPMILNDIFQSLPGDPELAIRCDLWNIVSGLMLDLGLPILKGRTRNEYAMEENVSPWDIDMTGPETACDNIKTRHMHEFPRTIQKSMFEALNFGYPKELEQLWEYRTRENIQSEEFLTLLAMAYIADGQFDRAEPLRQSLQQSSVSGRKEAAKLRQLMKK